MKETEAKFRVSQEEINRVNQQLIEAKNAMTIWTGMEWSIFLDTSERDMKRRGHLLRLRELPNGEVLLTFKRILDRSGKHKIAEEVEIKVSDFKTTLQLFGKIGYEEAFRYSKYRIHWQWDIGDGVYVELDRLENDKRFVEIEGLQEDIEAAVEILELNWDSSTTKTYSEILEGKQ